MTTRRYEMVLVADPTVPEPSHDEQITQIEGVIAELGGTVQKVDRWGRQKLAYPISRHTEGNYTLLLYDGAPTVESELLRRLRLSDTFLRFLSLRADHEKPPTAEEREALAESRREQLRRAAEREAEEAASTEESAAEPAASEEEPAEAVASASEADETAAEAPPEAAGEAGEAGGADEAGEAGSGEEDSSGEKKEDS